MTTLTAVEGRTDVAADLERQLAHWLGAASTFTDAEEFASLEAWRAVEEQVGLPLPDSPDYQTIAGFLLHRLGTVPRPGTVTTAGGYRFTIVEMDGPRIMKVRAEPEPPGQPGS